MIRMKTSSGVENAGISCQVKPGMSFKFVYEEDERIMQEVEPGLHQGMHYYFTSEAGDSVFMIGQYKLLLHFSENNLIYLSSSTGIVHINRNTLRTTMKIHMVRT